MALSFLVKFNQEPDWATLNARLLQFSKGLVEFFPVEGIAGDFHLGVSVSLRTMGNPIWWEFQSIANHLLSCYDCRVVDLYSGKVLDKGNLVEAKDLFYG